MTNMSSPLLFCSIHLATVNPSLCGMLFPIPTNIQADNCAPLAFLGQKLPIFKGSHFQWSLLGANRSTVEWSSFRCSAETY